MVRETRHLWVGNLPENIREDRIREQFKRTISNIKSPTLGELSQVLFEEELTDEVFEDSSNTADLTDSFIPCPSSSTPGRKRSLTSSSAGSSSCKRQQKSKYGRVQSVKLLPRVTKEETGEISMACTVAFMDIKSASKAHNSELKIDDRTLNTEYYEPAAIPSAASPQNTPSPYSTSPGSTRFPNGHGSTDEHGTPFSDRFYERPNSRVPADGEIFRRSAYSETARGRIRDRPFRNGPYNSIIDRHRPLNNSWGSYPGEAGGGRYNSSGSGSVGGQTDTGYTAPSSDGVERRNSDTIAKKKTKSRSGTRSPSPSGSTSSRSPSRSRSRSSSSSSSSSTSRDTSSTSSPKSRRQANSIHQPVVHSDDKRPLAICVKNLPLRSSDTSLKDGLFHEYKKHGKVTWVKVVGVNQERYAIVCFKKPEDVDKALEVSYDKLFFGHKIEVAPYQGYDVDDNDLRPYEAELDEFHPKATRTLFIGNLEKDVTASDLRKQFDQFGEIIEIDIKKQGVVSSYAFCQYSDIVSVVKAIRKMDGEHLGNNRVKLGFGKSMPTNCVWVDGVADNVNEKYLKIQFDPFGVINKVHMDRDKGQALIFYEQVVSAQTAVNKMRGFNLKNNKIQVDFASRECQESFFEHLEKQGTVLDRTLFEERRDSTSRSFDSTSNRYSRYDTPTRPRTSSYSSRSSATASQITSAIPSPGTPGSVTPRGTGSRLRMPRFEYFESNDQPFRGYDEYSQGSPGSHDDYDPAYFAHSPSHLDSLESRNVQTLEPAVTFPPPELRNLHKERVHLLEQLEDCPSSGDELMCPKKRMKLDPLDIPMSDVIIEANRDHRKVMEVRRLSDVNIKHHSRRPSVDSAKHVRDIGHERTSYLPHAVCKRRKTGGSDSSSRLHQYDHSGSESVGGSRPGTPLCDERPENFQPSEPRRVPREREGPLTLPLPRFAAQIMNRGSVSVAGIKGQKDNVLSSPPPAVTSPRISNPRPPSPIHHVPPPASPPPRPPSLSSNSSDSDGAPPSPSLEERIKSLDEKYEKWSGSRALCSVRSGDTPVVAEGLEKFRLRHKLLDLDLKEVQPSEIVKSVMAKRSVFDEDLKRLENVGEKYEPKDFGSFPRVVAGTSTPTLSSVPALQLSITPTLKLANATQQTTMLSPRSSGTTISAAKGLQYPFPSHPPSAPLTPTSVSSAVSSANLLATTSAITPSTTTRTGPAPSNVHGENRLKPCAPVALSSVSDTRTSSKVTVNRCASNNSVASTQKTASEKSVNIPNASEVSGAGAAESKHTKNKSSDKISCRRDSNSNSPRADVKTRRNSDTSARKIDDKVNCDVSDNQKERARSEERKKEQRLEKARLENERLEKEKAEKERIEKERIEKEKQEKERLEKERLEKERLERESELEKERLQKERIERERLEKERLEQERIENERRKEREDRERKEREERERKEREEQERKEREEQEREEREKKEREERERREREEQLEKEKLERERQEKERKEKERKDREERERKEREKEERIRKELEERERREARERKEREEKERRDEEDRQEKERSEKDRMEKDKDRSKRDEERRHKDDNHEKRKEDHRHRENHSEKSDTKHSDKHRDNNVDKHFYDKNTKDQKEDKKDNHENCKRDLHESRSHEKSKHHIRDEERRKESIKENRDNNIHEKHRSLSNDIKDSKEKPSIESRHMSLDIDKKNYENSLFGKDPSKRKERNNSLPANLNKRRISSHDSLDGPDDPKRIKLDKSERRDSRDSTRSDEKIKSKHKNNSLKHDKHNNTKESEEKRKDKDRDERHRSKHKLDKQKIKTKSRDKDSRESPTTPKSPITDKDFLARLDLRSNEEVDKQKKDYREKRKDSTEDERRERDDKKSDDKFKKDKLLMHQSNQCDKSQRNKDECGTPKSSEERKTQRKERVRKLTNSSDSDSDDDEPKKHSIFDIVDDEPAYISMYDKVKARSCKNMQKQEEEKRQEKIKAKFSQLKQSRAKREEKKRSTSWDEDSDSDRERMDKSEFKLKRSSKLCIVSSDDEELQDKPRNKKEMETDSDSDRQKQNKYDISDDDRINMKNSLYKSCKSRITSDTSDDDFKKTKERTDIFSDDQGFADNESKSYEIDRIKELKKERRNSKHQDEVNSQVFSSSVSPVMSEKEKFKGSFHDTSDEEIIEIKKERSDRKKHKKKQKRQKHSFSNEDLSKIEMMDSSHIESSEKSSKHHDKKRPHSKKDKKRDKFKDERDKSKKSKKNKSESKSDNKSGKVENLFGSLSEDSESGAKDVKENIEQKNIFPNKFIEESTNSVYNSESEYDTKKLHEEKEREREVHKRRKEKKRREKQERRLQEAAEAAAAEQANESSMDFADMGKQLEANIKDESIDQDDIAEETVEDSYSFSETPGVKETTKEERKKKKRKKSKEEKQKHHHHHHHDKNKLKSPDFKKEQPEFKKEEVKIETDYNKLEFIKESSPKTEIKIEIEETKPPSMPTITDFSPENKTCPNKLDFNISPINREPLISPIPKTPTTSKDKKRDKLIPCFGSAIDENLHESAIKSISSDFESVKQEPTIKEDEIKTEKTPESPEEKPRVVISQEETEDAVAALLGESFGSGEQFEECYSEEIHSTNEQSQNNDENNPQDDEEMRQAVQSLSATDLDVKPDTPQSEHELQIDTDTEEQEEISLRFDQPPKTPDISELLVPPKTPDIPSYFRNAEGNNASASSIVIKSGGIGSPPSLTPINPTPLLVADVKKKLEVDNKPTSLPILPEQKRTIISQAEKPTPVQTIYKSESCKIETKQEITKSAVIVSQPPTKQILTVTTASIRPYTTPPVVKISEPTYPPLTALSKPDQKSPTIEKKKLIPVLQNAQQKSPTLHALPARPPVQIKTQDATLLSPKSSTLPRIPITSVMVSKPLQANTIILPQAKIAHSLEPPKLVPTSEPRSQDIPKMVIQATTIPPSPFPGYVHTRIPVLPANTIQNIRNIQPQGLLVPTRQITPNTYSYINNTSPGNYTTIQSVPKEKIPEKIQEPMRLTSLSNPQNTINFPNSSQPTVTNVYMSATSNGTKPFMNVIHETSNPPPLVTQSSIIQSTSSLQQTQCENIKVCEKDIPINVIPENLKTSTPSPVIVATPRENLSELVKNPVPVKQESVKNPVPVKQELAKIPVPVKPELVKNPVPVKQESPKPDDKSDTSGTFIESMESITEELNLTLKKEIQEISKDELPKEIGKVEEISKKEIIEEIKPETTEDKPLKLDAKDHNKSEIENVSVIKEIEKFDEEKADTESIISDISKERSSADILSKDDPLDTKEDSDYWSAKEVNIDSVIKTLCSADELSDHSSEGGKDDWEDETKSHEFNKVDNLDKLEVPDKKEDISDNKSEDDITDEGVENEEKEITVRGGTRGRGGRGRGRRGRGGSVDRGGIQTRRSGKSSKESVVTTAITTPKRGIGRGGRIKTDRKVHKSESESPSTDVYEFRDDADEGTKEQRPRLILTIKSPAVSTGGNTQTAIIKEVTKDGAKEIYKEVMKDSTCTKLTDNKEDFASPVSNTRKSKRLQERDVSRNTVDDTIEDVVKNTIQTRALSNQNIAAGTRRSTRQVNPKQIVPETPRKSPRAGRKKDRRASEANDDSDVEKPKEDIVKSTPVVEVTKIEADKPKEPQKIEQKKPEQIVKEIPHAGLKAEMLRRVNREQNHEPTNLIDPVTGLLTPMRECEEGKYIPLPGSADKKSIVTPNANLVTTAPAQLPPKTSTIEVKQTSVITTPQQVTVVQQPKPQSFKAHVLASQAAKAVVSQQTLPVKPTTPSIQPQNITITKTTTSHNQPPVVVPNTLVQTLAVSKPVSQPVRPPLQGMNKTPAQNLNVNVSMAMNIAHVSPRTSMTLTKVKAPQMSPNQGVTLTPQQILQANKHPAHISNQLVAALAAQSQAVNIQKQFQQVSKGILNKGNHPIHSIHQQNISNTVASPPLSKSQQISNSTRTIQGPHQTAKGNMDPPKVDVSAMALGSRSTLSPQGQTRHIPPFDNMHGVRRSPPPAHQNSPSPQGDQMSHFSGLRGSTIHDISAYMHHSMPYQHLLRQNYHLPRSPLMPGNIEKSDSQEGEEAPVTSPPLELRRTANIGMPLSGRSTTVPHSLHSPHDRSTDSPQVGQGYNMHSARLQHYPPSHPGRYFDQTAEPPPAHRPMTSHNLAALGSDRPLHMASMGNPDRPMSSHIPPERPLSAHMPDRPLSSHIPPERPISHILSDRPLSGHLPLARTPFTEASHGIMGAGLGAAGNLIGAVERHHGVDAPTSQRGLQAATPPHASQVPPQADSLFALLQQYPCMWQGLLALKNDQAAVQMYFVSGNAKLAKECLPENTDGTTPPLRIFQRMRLEPPQVEGVSRKMQMQNEHCILLALPCGHDHVDVLKQSTNLNNGFIKYLQAKQAAGIVNYAAAGTTHPPAYVVHIFPSCEFVNENLRRIAPNLLERVADISHLLIVVTTA